MTDRAILDSVQRLADASVPEATRRDLAQRVGVFLLELLLRLEVARELGRDLVAAM